MIRRVALLAALVIGGSTAFAGARAPDCKPFNAKDLDKGYTFARVTPGQYRFLQGVWAMSPNLPGDMPPGDGAAIIRKEKTPGGVIAWTKGSLVCTIMPAPEKLLKLMSAIKKGQLDPDGQDI